MDTRTEGSHTGTCRYVSESTVISGEFRWLAMIAGACPEKHSTQRLTLARESLAAASLDPLC
jgi:hypothetical protein